MPHLLPNVHLAEVLEEREQRQVEPLPRVLAVPAAQGKNMWGKASEWERRP